MKNQSPPPIFIHSLFRSGSTYIFNVFRRAEHGYWCYQEPENELLRLLNEKPDALLEVSDDTTFGLRHPKLGKPYFWEFYELRKPLSGLFEKSISYDDFFINPPKKLPTKQHDYFCALINLAQGQAVLQCCRTFGRISSLKENFGGIHIHLWREPRNQWWSYKINDYFDPAVQLIYNARELPAVLDEIRRHCAITPHHSDDILAEFRHARRHPLASRENYFSFYALWLYSYLECMQQSDTDINIDQLSGDATYRTTTLHRLSELGISGLDFSDCSIPQASFSKQEELFFGEIESRVSDFFLMNGYDKQELEHALATQAEAAKIKKSTTSELIQDSVRARETALFLIDQIAKKSHITNSTLMSIEVEKQKNNQLSAQVNEARNKVHEANIRAKKAETNVQEANIRAEKSAEITRQAEARAELAEANLQEASIRARESAKKTRQAETRAEQAEALAHTLQMRYEIIVNSRTWRMTYPLRSLIDLTKRIRVGFFAWLTLKPGTRPMRIMQRALNNVHNQVKKRPRLKSRVLYIISHFPRLRDMLLEQQNKPAHVPSHTAQSFSEFICDFIDAPLIDDIPKPVYPRHLLKDYAKLRQQLDDRYTRLDINTQLISSIRTNQKIKLKKRISEDEAEHVVNFVIHIYLSLLRRFPAEIDAQSYASLIIKKQDITVAIDTISRSSEFLVTGYRAAP